MEPLLVIVQTGLVFLDMILAELQKKLKVAINVPNIANQVVVGIINMEP